MPAPGPRSVLEALTRSRLAAVGRELGVAVPASGTKEVQIAALASSPALDDLPGLLRLLGRDELRDACRAHGLDDTGRSRPALLARLLAAAGGSAAAVSPTPPSPARRTRPEAGDVVQVRHRQYLVEEVIPPGGPGEASRAVLSGLDDDNQGRRLEVLWEIELGGRILQPELHGPDTRGRLDPPRAFAAYLNALRSASRATPCAASSSSISFMRPAPGGAAPVRRPAASPRSPSTSARPSPWSCASRPCSPNTPP